MRMHGSALSPMVALSLSVGSALLLLPIPSARAQTAAWYRFNNGANGAPVTTALDSGPNGLNGTAVGALTYTNNVAPLPNAGPLALNASGDGNFVRVADNAALDIQTDFTVEMYFKPTSPYTTFGSNPSLLVTKQNDTGFGNFLAGYEIQYDAATGRPIADIGFAGQTGVVVSASSGNAADGNWHHVALVLQHSFGGNPSVTALTLFFDGAQVGQTTGNFSPIFYGTAPLYIGAGNYGSDPNGVGPFRRNFDGLLDEVRISNVALAPSQFLNAVASTGAPEPGTLALLGAGIPPLAGLVARRRRRRR